MLQKIIRKVVGKIRFLLTGDAAKAFVPHKVNLREFSQAGRRFYVNNPIEAYRIESFGGEREFTRMILDELRPADVFFDIGSSVGLVTVHAAEIADKVVAFEPDPEVRASLERNLAANPEDNVTIVDWAVSDTIARTVLYTDGSSGGSPSLRKVGNRPSIEVETRSIDAAIEHGELPIPDVMKIDIEGAEMLAIRGMEKLLRQPTGVRKVFIEIHPEFLPAFGSSAAEVKTAMTDCGFTICYEKKRSDQIHCVYER